MIFVTPSSRQDIKIAEDIRPPAPLILMIPVLAFYLSIVGSIGWLLITVVPLINPIIQQGTVHAATIKVEGENRKFQRQIAELEGMQGYIASRQAWAKLALPSGILIRNLVAALPSSSKLKSLTYQYQIPEEHDTGGRVSGTVHFKLLFQGTIEDGPIRAAIQKLDPRLEMANCNVTKVNDDTQMDVEWRLN